MTKPFKYLSGHLSYNLDGEILLNGIALREKEHIKVILEVNGVFITVNDSVGKLRTKYHPEGVFRLMGTYNVPFSSLRARRMTPEEYTESKNRNKTKR